jgi:hypothetical protein
MSDLTLMAENIRDAVQTMERAKKVGEELRERATRENYAAFRAQMGELTTRLRHLNIMLLHEDEMAFDELADALDRAFELPAPEYRHADAHSK